MLGAYTHLHLISGCIRSTQSVLLVSEHSYTSGCVSECIATKMGKVADSSQLFYIQPASLFGSDIPKITLGIYV